MKPLAVWVPHEDVGVTVGIWLGPEDCSVVRVDGDEARTWRAMLRWKPPTPLPVDAFLGTVVLEEKDHFVGRPRLGNLRIEIT